MATGMVLAPKPIRLGEPHYWDHLNDFYLRLSGSSHDDEDEDHNHHSCGKTASNCPTGLFQNLAPTTTTYTDSLYTFDVQRRTRLPCECFKSLHPQPLAEREKVPIGLGGSLKSEFEQDDRLSTTNLIDWQTKESWVSDAIRDQVYRGLNRNHPILLYSAADFRSTGSAIQKSDINCKCAGEANDDAESRSSTGSRNEDEPPWASPVATSNPFLINSPPIVNYSSEDSNSGFFTSKWSSGSSPVFFRPSKSLTPPSPVATRTQKPNKNDNKSFKCDHLSCCKQFSRKEELTRHKKTHCSDKHFQCEICKRKFNRKDHMTKHQATHQDVSMRRRYGCPECDRCYTRSDALSRHRSSAHSIHSYARRHRQLN